MAKIGINYSDDANGITYENVCIIYGNNTLCKIFHSGDFVKDWYDCIKYLININEEVSYYSSVDYFSVDAPFIRKYIYLYVPTNEYLLSDEEIPDGILMFVHNHNPNISWEEMTTIYSK